MKKIFFSIILGFGLTTLFTGCEDVNDQFNGLDDKTEPTNLVSYSYTLVDADYTAISKSALAAAQNATDSSNAKSIASNKYFTATVPASNYIPYLLKTKFPYGDIGSSAMITYSLGQDKPAYMNDLTTITIVSDAEYQTVWGHPIEYVSAFTPAKSPLAKIPGILAKRFPTATTGTYKVVECNYSAEEATLGMVDFKYFYDDFENHTSATASPYTLVGENGWQQKDTSGTSTKATYICKTYSSNKYAQVSSFGSNEINNVFLLTKQIDLTNAISPIFTFNINVGYWTNDCLSVYVSDDFDGNKDHIKNANWVDLSSNFTFPQTASYAGFASAGEADLSAYSGKKVYIAFKYSGDSRTGVTPQKTTTYQIDNIKVSEMRNALSIPSSEKQYFVFKYSGSAWITPTTTDGVFVALQGSDYAAMGLSYISTTNIPLYLPKFLSTKFPYALNGDVKTVVYKSSSSSATTSAATQYTLTNGVWTSNTFKVNNTDQFIFTADGWVFDPTVKFTMTKADYQIITDYVWKSPTLGSFINDQSHHDVEYYFGASAYNYYEFDIKLSTHLSKEPATFTGLTDEQSSVIMNKRVQDAIVIMLQAKYPLAVTQVSGIDVHYIVTTYIYNSVATTLFPNKAANYTYDFKCTTDGAAGTAPTFTYVSGPILN